MYPETDALNAYAKEILAAAKIPATDDKVDEVVDDLQAAVALAVVEALPEELSLEFERWAERDDATEQELSELLDRSGLDVELISRKAMLRYRDELIRGAKATQDSENSTEGGENA